jgi:hypothetical protein
VSFTYNGSSTVPTSAGSYTVVGTISNSNYTGTVSGTLVISRASAKVKLGSLSQTYAGSPRAATATTTPAGLMVDLTYNGSSTAPTAAGSYVVVGTIVNSNYAGSSTGTLVISQVTTVARVASSSNPALAQSPVTFTATVSSPLGTPTGTVSFLDGTTVLGQGTLSDGVATLTTSSLAAGAHSITAFYSGDTNFVSATSGTLTQSVLDFSLTPVSGSGTVPSQTVVPGGTATYPLAIIPTAGTIFPAPVTLTVTGLPEGATGTITPATWTQLISTSWSFPANTPIVNPTLTIQLPSVTAHLDHEDSPNRKLPLLLWAILLLPFAGKLRRAGKRLGRTTPLLPLLALGMGAMFGLSGCGSTSGFFAQQQKAYTVTVTATSGTLSHSTTVTLTVE